MATPLGEIKLSLERFIIVIPEKPISFPYSRLNVPHCPEHITGISNINFHEIHEFSSDTGDRESILPL